MAKSRVIFKEPDLEYMVDQFPSEEQFHYLPLFPLFYSNKCYLNYRLKYK